MPYARRGRRGYRFARRRYSGVRSGPRYVTASRLAVASRPRNYTGRNLRYARSTATRRVPVSGLALSKCAQEFVKATLAPFDTNIMPCNLWSLPIASYRQKGWVRAILTSGQFFPEIAMGSQIHSYIFAAHTYSNNMQSFIYPNAAQTMSVALSTGGTTVVMNNCLYADANFDQDSANGYQWMPVLTAVRIRYNGPADQMAGTMYALEQPSHASLYGMTPAAIQSQYYARSLPITTQWTTIVTTGPKNPNEYEFNYAVAGFTPIIGFLLVNVPSASQFFEIEICSYTELANVPNNNAWSEQDLRGGQIISQAFELVGKSLCPEQQGRQIYNQIKRASNMGRLNKLAYRPFTNIEKGTSNATTVRRSYTPSASRTPTRTVQERIRDAWNAGQRAWNEYGRPAFNRARQVYQAANAIGNLITDAQAAEVLDELRQIEYVPPPV